MTKIYICDWYRSHPAYEIGPRRSEELRDDVVVVELVRFIIDRLKAVIFHKITPKTSKISETSLV